MPRKIDDPWGRAEILLGPMSKMDGTDSRERARRAAHLHAGDALTWTIKPCAEITLSESRIARDGGGICGSFSLAEIG